MVVVRERVDARAAARGVHVALVREPVDLDGLLDHVVADALEPGLRRRVVAGRQRLRRLVAAGGERRLGAGQVRRGRGGREAGGADGDAVEEVPSSDPIAPVSPCDRPSRVAAAGQGPSRTVVRLARQDRACDPSGPGGELGPGEAHDLPAGQREDHVALAVGFEAGRRAVVGVAVDLDDEIGIPPGEVDLFVLDAGVDLRPWDSVVVAEREEALLHLAAGHGAAGAVEGQHRL